MTVAEVGKRPRAGAARLDDPDFAIDRSRHSRVIGIERLRTWSGRKQVCDMSVGLTDYLATRREAEMSVERLVQE